MPKQEAKDLEFILDNICHASFDREWLNEADYKRLAEHVADVRHDLDAMAEECVRLRGQVFAQQKAIDGLHRQMRAEQQESKPTPSWLHTLRSEGLL